MSQLKIHTVYELFGSYSSYELYSKFIWMDEFVSESSWIHDYEYEIFMNSWIWIEKSWTLWTWNSK